MNTQQFTLAQTISVMFLDNKIQSQNDLVTLARFVMTDLEVSYKEALEFIEKVVNAISKVQDKMLSI